MLEVSNKTDSRKGWLRFVLTVLIVGVSFPAVLAQDARSCLVDSEPYIGNKCKSEITVFTCMKGTCRTKPGEKYYTWFFTLPPGGTAFEEAGFDKLEIGACFGSIEASITSNAKDYTCIDLPETLRADTSLPARKTHPGDPNMTGAGSDESSSQSSGSAVLSALHSRNSDCRETTSSCADEKLMSEDIPKDPGSQAAKGSKTLVCPGLRERVTLERINGIPHLIRLQGTAGIIANVNMRDLAREKDRLAEALLAYQPKEQPELDTSDYLEGTTERTDSDAELEELQKAYVEADKEYWRNLNHHIRDVCGLGAKGETDAMTKLGKGLIEWSNDCSFDVGISNPKHCLYKAPSFLKRSKSFLQGRRG